MTTTRPPAYCPGAANQHRHYYNVTLPPIQVHQCRYCPATYTLDRMPLRDEPTAWPAEKGLSGRNGHPPASDTVSMKKAILKLKVGQSYIAEHRNMVCELGPKGGVRSCNLGKLMARLKGTLMINHDVRTWTVKHLESGVAYVRRT